MCVLLWVWIIRNGVRSNIENYGDFDMRRYIHFNKHLSVLSPCGFSDLKFKWPKIVNYVENSFYVDPAPGDNMY